MPREIRPLLQTPGEIRVAWLGESRGESGDTLLLR